MACKDEIDAHVAKRWMTRVRTHQGRIAAYSLARLGKHLGQKIDSHYDTIRRRPDELGKVAAVAASEVKNPIRPRKIRPKDAHHSLTPAGVILAFAVALRKPRETFHHVRAIAGQVRAGFVEQSDAHRAESI